MAPPRRIVTSGRPVRQAHPVAPSLWTDRRSWLPGERILAALVAVGIVALIVAELARPVAP